jgi:hypothetical protein
MVLLSGCVLATNVPAPQPAAPHVDMSAFRRVWIAGFVTNAVADIDLNVETVRLLRRRLNPRTPLRVIEAGPLTIRDEAELSNTARWQRLAEEYGEPLIVTGVVTLATARPVPADSASTRPTYRLRKGFVLEATFLFIDGRTGEVVARQPFPKETLYGPDQRASTLSLYFQLMDRVIPEFLRVFR